MQLQRYQYIDPGYLLATVGGNQDIFLGLARTFLDTAPPIFQSIGTAVVSGDLPALRRESHSLKGMASLIGAQALSDVLRQIEIGARDGTTPSQESCARLAVLFAEVYAEMTGCLQESATRN